MNPSDWLTDEVIEAAFERRAGRADPGALRETILTLSAASSQRSPRRLPSRSTMSTPVLGPALFKGIAAATVIGVIAAGAALFVSRPNQPAVGGPTPDATFDPNTSARPSASPSAVVVSPREPTWTATGTMITPRPGHQAVLLLDGRVLVVGGPYETISPSNAAELYDPDTGTWAATGSMLAPRFEFTATLLPDGKVLVAGGAGLLTSAELYDPVSGTWTATGAMATGRYEHTATLLHNGKVLVAGGIVAGDVADDVVPFAELYDPTSGAWSSTGAMAADRSRHTATLLPDGKLLVAGGDQDGSPDGPTAEIYDPLTETWTATADMATARSAHTATLLSSGQVLVAGGLIHGSRDLCSLLSASGVDCSNPMASAELFDPETGAWTTTQDMLAARGNHTATLLPDGTVLVTGGGGSADETACQCHALLGSAELYDPASGTWKATASMAAVRDAHTATLLPDGRVLVASGYGMEVGIGSVVLASAELYDPGFGN